MRKFTVCLALIAAAMFGGNAVATAAPGPNGHNDYGLCKAYFAGSDTGKSHKRDKGPFPALESKAGDQDGDGDTDEDDVEKYCESATPGGKGKAQKKSRATRTSTTSVTRATSLSAVKL
jgi:hypothetical protein